MSILNFRVDEKLMLVLMQHLFTTIGNLLYPCYCHALWGTELPNTFINIMVNLKADLENIVYMRGWKTIYCQMSPCLIIFQISTAHIVNWKICIKLDSIEWKTFRCVRGNVEIRNRNRMWMSKYTKHCIEMYGFGNILESNICV